MSLLAEFRKWAKEHREEVRAAYFQFLRFRSISTDLAFRGEMAACSNWLQNYILKKIGMKAECIETQGCPLVYAEDLSAGPKASTLLIYGHYDVQPVDPLELWKSDPFEPVERDGLVYARGAVDDKGQILYALLAVQCWKELGHRLPINLKFCIEGEEESSSVGLALALPLLKEKLKADYLLVPDFGQLDKETPALSLGARGMVSLEVTLTGSHGDLHSGLHGGIAYNPNRALVELLAKLWDSEGRVQVKGFYDDVLETSEEEQKLYAFRFDPEQYKREFGIEAFSGEKGRTMKESNCFRPTLEINGLVGGYTGPGFKTVIPARASAKISCRLVPHQDPAKIGRQAADFLKQNVCPGIQVHVDVHPGAYAFRGNPTSKLARAVEQAATETTGKKCEKILSGASIPIVADLAQSIGAEVVGMGYGLPEDNIHAPNESFDFGRLEKGFLTVARTLELL